MSNKKQTAMQEFLGELQRRLLIIESEPDGLARETMIYNLLIDSDRYLSIEKESIMEAFDEGKEYEYQYHINSAPNFDSEQYYKETYEHTTK